MSKSTFHVTFDGPGLSGGEIDVRALAPALLELGEIVQRANKLVNGNRADAVLRLKASEEGSFTAFLSVDVSLLTAVGDLLDSITANPDRIAAAKDLIALLLGGGAVAGGTCAGFFKVLKWLQGARPDQVMTEGQTTSIVVKGKGSLVIDNRTILLLNDPPTRNAAQAFAGHALKVPGVDTVEFGSDDTGESLKFDRMDATSFVVPPPEAAAPVTETNERVMLLRIVTSAFRDGYKWRFSDGGDKPFSAEMRDVDFLNSVMEGRVPLTANDTLKCIVEERQVLAGSALTKEITILKVIDHFGAAQQLKLL